MTWLKIDDGFAENPKISDLSDRAFRLHVAALCYCARNLTDGLVTARQLRVLAAIVGSAKPTRYVCELVDAELWSEAGEDGDFAIKDYLEYNPDAESVKRQRAERSAAGKRGAATRWRDKGDDKSHSNSHSGSHEAVVMAVVDAPSRPVPTPKDLSRAVPVASNDAPPHPTEQPGDLTHIRNLIQVSLGEAS